MQCGVGAQWSNPCPKPWQATRKAHWEQHNLIWCEIDKGSKWKMDFRMHCSSIGIVGLGIHWHLISSGLIRRLLRNKITNDWTKNGNMWWHLLSHGCQPGPFFHLLHSNQDHSVGAKKETSIIVRDGRSAIHAHYPFCKGVVYPCGKMKVEEKSERLPSWEGNPFNP